MLGNTLTLSRYAQDAAMRICDATHGYLAKYALDDTEEAFRRKRERAESPDEP